MKKKFLLMGIMLMGFAALFTTSCVQGDLFDDLYEDDSLWGNKRNKRSKDIGAFYCNTFDYDDANSYMNYPSFINGECAAFAVACVSGTTPYNARMAIIKAATGKSSISNQDVSDYFESIVYDNGYGSMTINESVWIAACTSFGKTPNLISVNHSNLNNQINNHNAIFAVFTSGHIAKVLKAAKAKICTKVVEVWDPSVAGVPSPSGMSGYITDHNNCYSLPYSDIIAFYSID